MLPNLAAQMLLILAKATVLLALAALFLRWMQRRSTAAHRHLVCGTTLAALLLLPITALVPLPGEIAKWPVFHVAIGSSATAPHPSGWLDWSRLLLFLWISGAVVFALRNLIGFLIVWKKRRQFAVLDDPAWTSGLFSVTLRMGNITSPAACGLFSPTILLPEEARHWDAFRRKAVLLHEMAHIRRNDCLWQQIAAYASAVFWFHPLVWRIAARLCREQELACDDLVLAAGMDPGAYATLLLNSAQDLSSGSLFACAFHGKSPAVQLRARFANILEPKERTGKNSWTKRFATALACLLLTMSSVTLARAEHIYRIGGDVISPKLIDKVEPEYTAAAKAAKIQGTVLLSVVIGKNGRARDIHVVRSLDPGLDANAIGAITKWRFAPAQRNGKPVTVQAKVEVHYRLK